jgi:twitching motility protein PilT
MKDLLFRPRGLILVVGPTGSGKTTTLATMMDIINTERDCHIITVEDPIEYYHQHKKSIVTQRELGVDVPSFAEALKRGLRQDPDVILVGEMRDLETMEAAITAAETGHLVFATLHTTGSARTVDRIIDAFPTNQQEQIRTQLASSILAVISQVLLVRASGKGRIAAFEIMVTTPSIQNLIREAKTYRITSDIQTGAKYGMKTLDASLLELYKKGLITYGDLLTKCQDPESIIAKLKLESA